MKNIALVLSKNIESETPKRSNITKHKRLNWTPNSKNVYRNKKKYPASCNVEATMPGIRPLLAGRAKKDSVTCDERNPTKCNWPRTVPEVGVGR